MVVEKRSKPELHALDPGLVGEWKDGAGKRMRIGNDNWQFTVIPSRAYTISTDGLVLQLLPPHADRTWHRIYGSGQSIVGVCSLTKQDGGSVHVEEWTYRANGTYTSQWTRDGAFDTEWNGIYSDDGSNLRLEERRALVQTTPPDQIYFDRPYGTDYSGTYVINGPDSWTLTLGATTTDYTRVV